MSVHESASHPVGSQRGAGLSVAILAFSAFLIVTTEFLIVGLLPALARDLDISISMAGQLVTLFAFTVMIFGPPLTAMLSPHLLDFPLRPKPPFSTHWLACRTIPTVQSISPSSRRGTVNWL